MAMLKHRGFPGRLRGTDYQFTIRREGKKVTPLQARERYQDRRPPDRKADTAFLAALIEHFGEEPFERGNLDAGRLNWLLGREVKYAGFSEDPTSYEQLLQVDFEVVADTFPNLVPDHLHDDYDEDEDDDDEEDWNWNG